MGSSTSGKLHGSDLLIASRDGNVDDVKLLLAKDVDVNVQDNFGNNMLMHASSGGHTEIVDLLLKRGANINMQNNDGYTALMIALNYNHLEIVKLLLAEGANLSIQNNYNDTALIIALYCCKLNTIELLLAEDVDKCINIRDDSGNTALICSLWIADHSEIVKILLERGASDCIDNQNYTGDTALTIASCRNYPKTAKLLLKYNANPNIKNTRNKSAIDYMHESEIWGGDELRELAKKYE